jgi:O-antigen/teichoic acid export membrane protein
VLADGGSDDIARERSETEQVVGSVIVSGAAQLGAKGILFALNVIAALAIVRYLGPSTYGDYIFVLSFAAIFGLLSELGINKVAAREMSRDPAQAAGVIGTALGGQLMLATVGWAAAQLAFAIVGGRPDLQAAMATASLLYFTEAFSLSFAAIFQVRLALQYDAIARVIAQALDTALILWLVSSHAGLLALIAAPVLTGAIGVAVAAALVRSRMRIAARFDRARLLPLIREALPLGITSIVVIAYLRLDSVLLGILRTPHEVGIYGAASRPVEYVVLALAVLVNVLFPLLARWYGVDPSRFAALFAHGASALLATSMPIVVMALAFADQLVAILYPSDFAASATVLRVLIGSVVLTVLGAWAGFALLSASRQGIVLACNVVALVLNIVLNLALIPSFGYVGAAAVALATSVVATVSTLVFARGIGVSLDGPRCVRLLIANVCVGAVAWVALSLRLPWPVAAAVAFCSYPLFVWLWRAISREEIALAAAGIR